MRINRKKINLNDNEIIYKKKLCKKKIDVKNLHKKSISNDFKTSFIVIKSNEIRILKIYINN